MQDRVIKRYSCCLPTIFVPFIGKLSHENNNSKVIVNRCSRSLLTKRGYNLFLASIIKTNQVLCIPQTCIMAKLTSAVMNKIKSYLTTDCRIHFKFNYYLHGKSLLFLIYIYIYIGYLNDLDKCHLNCLNCLTVIVRQNILSCFNSGMGLHFVKYQRK